MNCNFKHILSVTLLVSSAAFAADATTAVTPFLNYRSQSQNLARLKSGTVGFENKADMDKHYGNFSITPEYSRSFNGDDTAQSLFGCYYLQGCNKLNITGSDVVGRSSKDLLADWFDLSDTYQGSVTFEPTIQSFTADLNLYWGMAEWVEGLFFRVHAPITWTKWNLGASFKTTDTGSTAVGHTYLTNAETFFCQKGVDLSDTYTSLPLNCARFCGCMCNDNQSKTRLADIQADIGCNFLSNENYHLGLFARVVAPTGNTPKAEWLFEPVIGNGHFWEFGGGLTSSAIMWRSKEEDKHFGLYIDGNVTHLFTAEQNRVFDLKDKPLSRYMRAFNPTTLEYAPIANLTSCEMKVNVAVQADIVGMLNFTCKNWSYDLGYNFWMRTCEKFNCVASCDSCSSCDNACNSCDECSTCNTCCGQCVIRKGNDAGWLITHADNTINNFGLGDELVLTDTDIDYDGARTKGMSNKVFGHIEYNWMDREIVPYLGIGGEVEFGSNKKCCSTTPATTLTRACDSCDNSCSTDCNSCDTSCDSDCSGCRYASLSQWGVWIKGGCSF